MKFDWGEEEEDSFLILKEAITGALLVYPKEGGDLYWIQMLQIKL